jgi:hypothetical protein
MDDHHFFSYIKFLKKERGKKKTKTKGSLDISVCNADQK